MHLIERQVNVWSPNFGRQEVWQMPTKSTVVDIIPAKISPALPLCQKNWFSGKVRLDDYYAQLRSVASSWIHIGVKRISQAYCLHHLKNMEKNCKTQLWEKKQNRPLFLDHPVYFLTRYIQAEIGWFNFFNIGRKGGWQIRQLLVDSCSMWLCHTCVSLCLTHILPMLHFCTPRKSQKTKGFLTFSVGTEM